MTRQRNPTEVTSTAYTVGLMAGMVVVVVVVLLLLPVSVRMLLLGLGLKVLWGRFLLTPVTLSHLVRAASSGCRWWFYFILARMRRHATSTTSRPFDSESYWPSSCERSLFRSRVGWLITMWLWCSSASRLAVVIDRLPGGRFLNLFPPRTYCIFSAVLPIAFLLPLWS